MNARRAITVLVTTAVTVTAMTSLAAAAAPGAHGRGDVVDRAVTFTVQNLDRTALGPSELQTCPADASTQGATWTVQARLVAPQRALHRPESSATVYVNGLTSSGRTEFDLDAVPGYDFAVEEARAGHASIVIDRIGYGASTIPNGNDVCTGADADIVHQVVDHVRAGDYGGPSFDRVALAGWSAGGLIAEIEAYTFHDVDALAVFAYEDQGFSPFLFGELGKHAARCANAPSGYSPTFDDRGDTVDPADNTARAMFSSAADPRVVAAVLAAHEPDPCGENPLPYIATNPAQLASVTVPVLLVYGQDDALFDANLGSVQASHFGSADTTVQTIAGSGHLLMLDRSAPAFRAAVGTWLDEHGL